MTSRPPSKCRAISIGPERLALEGGELGTALARQRQHGEEVLLGEGPLLRRALDLDDPALAGEDEIGIGLGGAVLLVVEVEDRPALGDAAGDGAHLARERQLGHGADLLQVAEGECQGDIAAGDGGGAGSPIGLDHVAVDLDLALAEAGEIGDGAEAPADQALDLMGAPALPAARGLARAARAGRLRQHAVFRRDPAASGVAQEGRHRVLDRGGAEDLSIAEAGEAGTLRIFIHAWLQADLAQLVGRTAIGAHRDVPFLLVSCPRNSRANFWDKQATKINDLCPVATENLMSGVSDQGHWRREASLPAGGLPAPGRSGRHHLLPPFVDQSGGPY